MSSGNFLLNVKANGYSDINQNLDVSPLKREFTMKLEPLPKTYNVIRL